MSVVRVGIMGSIGPTANATVAETLSGSAVFLHDHIPACYVVADGWVDTDSSLGNLFLEVSEIEGIEKGKVHFNLGEADFRHAPPAPDYFQAYAALEG